MDIEDFTIIVPTRNEARNIPRFLASIPARIQLIVVDSSEDETPDLIAAQRPANTLVLRVQVSISQARQMGAQAAETSWLLFTDADIIFAPDYFDCIQSLDHHDLLYGPKLSLDEYQSYYRWIARCMELSDKAGIPAASGSNLAIRRSAFFQSGGFDLTLRCNEDSEIAWRVRRQGYSSAFAPELIVYAIDHRRLRQGLWWKTRHSLARCALLYLNLMPSRWRNSDWGYWTTEPARRLPSPKNGPW